jgi:hypothetical protein
MAALALPVQWQVASYVELNMFTRLPLKIFFSGFNSFGKNIDTVGRNSLYSTSEVMSLLLQ